eukprot:gene13589-28862_t
MININVSYEIKDRKQSHKNARGMKAREEKRSIPIISVVSELSPRETISSKIKVGTTVKIKDTTTASPSKPLGNPPYKISRETPISRDMEPAVSPDRNNRRSRHGSIKEEPGKGRCRMRRVTVEEPFWDNNFMCMDRDELTRQQDNMISKLRDTRENIIMPTRVSVSEEKKRSLPSKNPRARAPTRTSGDVLNLQLAKDRLMPPKDVIHPENKEGFELHTFVVSDYTEDWLARPRAVDRSISTMQRIFQSISQNTKPHFNTITIAKNDIVLDKNINFNKFMGMTHTENSRYPNLNLGKLMSVFNYAKSGNFIRCEDDSDVLM